jgi:nucleoside-diphosphate-sugar epimerase
MLRLRYFRLTRGVVLRAVADGLMINTALVIALAFNILQQIIFERADLAPQATSRLLQNCLAVYEHSAWLLTLVCLIVFYGSGFYTFGRAYQGRYKALVVTQAVSLSYLLSSYIYYFINSHLAPSRTTWVLAWLISLSMLVGARMWSLVWRNVIRAERELISRPVQRKVRRVLVIGGAGYIGSALLPKLLAKGYYVRVLDLTLYGMEPIRDVMGHPNLELVKADFRHVDKVVQAVRGMDALVHLGAIVGDPACALDKELTIEVNLMATRMIADVARASQVLRFIFASTCSVYGASDETLDECSELRPVSLYARSKIASERILMSLATPDFAPTSLRFATIFGLSGRTRFDLVVNLLTAKAMVEGIIPIFGGSQWRPFLHVDDAALAILKTLEAPIESVREQIFNAGSDDLNYTIQQVGEIVQRLRPEAQLVSSGEDTDLRNYRVDFSKIRNRLGFVPQWTLVQGIAQVIEAIRSGSVVDYREPKYSNSKFLAEHGANRISAQNSWAYDLIGEVHMPAAALEGVAQSS